MVKDGVGGSDTVTQLAKHWQEDDVREALESVARLGMHVHNVRMEDCITEALLQVTQHWRDESTRDMLCRLARCHNCSVRHLAIQYLATYWRDEATPQAVNEFGTLQ